MNNGISVIVCAFNAEKTIKNCLESILRQHLTDPLQLIVINDGSTDKTKKILHSLYGDNDNITIIDKINTGVSQSRNVALTHVKNKFVTFVDADDYIDENHLQSMLNQYVRHPDIQLSITGYFKEKVSGEIIRRAEGNKQLMSREIALKNIFRSYMIEGYLVNKLFLNEIIQKYRIHFDENIDISEDLDFCIQYLHYCNVISYNPLPTYHYVMYDNSQLHSVQIGKTFSTKHIELVSSLLTIKHRMLDSYPSVISSINARICWAATVVLRAIYAAPNRSDVDINLIKQMKILSREYKKDFLSNDILPGRDKIIYVFNLIAPSLWAYLWNNVLNRHSRE